MGRGDGRRLAIAGALFVVLVLIAAFVRDDVVRPYGGDVLVVVFLHFLVRALTPLGRMQAAAAVLAFACGVEAAQAFDVAARLGLADNPLARTVIGVKADVLDVVAYVVGALVAVIADRR